MPRSAANAVRELANVLTRMPNQATPTEPAMPTTLKARMMRDLGDADLCASDAEVDDDDGADEELEHEDELHLRDEVRLAGLVDELGDLEHRLVHRQVLELLVDHEAEHEAERAHDEAEREQVPARHAEELDALEVRQDQVHLALRLVGEGADADEEGAQERGCAR